MKVAVVSAAYSEGMGYVENCLPKFLSRLGHDVDLITSDWNVYGQTPEYDRTYRPFLGPPKQPIGLSTVDGYRVHRLRSSLIGRYVYLQGLIDRVACLAPDVVHCTEVASIPTFTLALSRALRRGGLKVPDYLLFTETHQHLSIVKPFLRDGRGHPGRRAWYRLTRTLLTSLASLAVERCYAVAPDCASVAHRFYGVPLEKIHVQSLGADVELFRPAATPAEREERRASRVGLGIADDDIVCLYTGRFSPEKNPLLLARAVERLAERRPAFHSLFIGDGVQKHAIASCRNARVVPFMKHAHLVKFYRLADVAVWPLQESMSMLDAAAAGLPLVVSDRMGESERVRGNGRVYRENSQQDLARVLTELSDPAIRRALGEAGRAKMIQSFNWLSIAKALTSDYIAARSRRDAAPSVLEKTPSA